MSVIVELCVELPSGFKVTVERLELPDRGVTVLKGPSGSGKTTFLKGLCGLMPTRPGFRWEFTDSGKLLDLAKLPTGDRRLGVVFQNSDLFPHMTGLENLRFAARCRKLQGLKGRAEIDELVRGLDIDECLNRTTNEISGGERQRVALARSLIGQPRMLLLDEPFAALDEENRQRARGLLKDILKKRPIPVLLITHDESDAKAFDANILTLSEGRLKYAE